MTAHLLHSSCGHEYTSFFRTNGVAVIDAVGSRQPGTDIIPDNNGHHPIGDRT